jgi:hypothetical protein
MEIDWLENARAFKESALRYLSSAEGTQLELQDLPPHSSIPAGISVRLQEIPCVHRVMEAYQGESGLRFFMDGIQRTLLWQHYDYDGFRVPIYLHLSGAVIMKRTRNRSFVPFKTAFRSAVLVPRFIYEALDGPEGVENTGAENPWDLNEVRWSARTHSGLLRQSLEEGLMRDFLESGPPGILTKDGSIPPSIEEKGLLGIIKSHDTLYLQEHLPRLQQMVWAMAEFYRSSSFLLKSDSGEVMSFYLRIHPPASPETGLLRIEYTDPYLDLDRVSKWLIAERSVRAYCSRWDRQIYPINICEEYLKAQMPRTSNLQFYLRSLEVSI